MTPCSSTARGTSGGGKEFAIIVTNGFLLPLTLVTGLLIAQVCLATRLRPAVRTLVWVQAVYWFSSYVLRAVYLWVNRPGFGEVLYDYSMSRVGYDEILPRIEWVVVAGQLAFVIVLAVVHLAGRCITTRLSRPSLPTRTAPEMRTVLVVLLAAGWAGRVFELFGGSPAFSLVGSLSNVAPVAFVLFWQLRAGSAVRLVPFVVVVVGEALWSVVGAEKTPILTILAALILRVGVESGFRALLRWVPLMVVVVFSSFAVVQPLKGVDTTARAIGDDQSPLQALTSSVLERTDTLTPISDAILYPTPPWLSPGAYAESVITGALPTGLHESVGIRWTQEVKSASFADQFQQVFIAAGVLGEGYVQGGIVGAVVEAALLGVFVIAVGAALDSRRPSIAIGACIPAFGSSLYEGGFLWISESLSGAIQTGILCMVIAMLVRTYRARQITVRVLAAPRGEPRFVATLQTHDVKD